MIGEALPEEIPEMKLPDRAEDLEPLVALAESSEPISQPEPEPAKASDLKIPQTIEYALMILDAITPPNPVDDCGFCKEDIIFGKAMAGKVFKGISFTNKEYDDIYRMLKGYKSHLAYSGIDIRLIPPKMKKPAKEVKEAQNQVSKAPIIPHETNIAINDLTSLLPMCIFHDPKYGTPSHIDVPQAAEYITMAFHPRTLPSGDVCIYEDGIYKRDGDDIIKKILMDALKSYVDKNGDVLYDARAEREIFRRITQLTLTEITEFDKDLNIINMANGLYNWATGEFKPHDPNYISLVQIPVTYDPMATCTNIEKQLDLTARAKDIPKIFEFIAYVLYRKHVIQKILLVYGPGSSGKSVVLDIIAAFVGEENKSAVSLQELSNNRFAGSDLFGKLVNVCADLDEATTENTGMLKKLTSEKDKVRAERKFKDAFDFVNSAKLVYSCNKLPKTEDDSTGYYRRFEPCAFDKRIFDESDYDPVFINSLTSPNELSGLFNKVIKMLPDLINRGHFTNQLSIAEATNIYKTMSNLEESFFDKFVKEDLVSYVSKDELYTYYMGYCEKLCAPYLTKTKFGRYVMANIPWVKGQGNAGRTITGNNNIPRRVAVWLCTRLDKAAFDAWLVKK